MFAKKTNDYVEEAIKEEIENSVKNYGKFYASKHEAFAVLKEEVEEAKEIVEGFRKLMHIFWLSVRGQPITCIDDYKDWKHIDYLQRQAKNAIKELIQVVAVCEKIKTSLDEDKI